MLLPWARCVLWCSKTSTRMIAPRWRKARLGPYLRNERDKRSYHHLFSPGPHISGIRRTLLLLTKAHIPEDCAPDTPHPNDDRIVLFSGMSDGFVPLSGSHTLLRSQLQNIIRPHLYPDHESPLTEPYIGIHVRRGDFTPTTNLAQLRRGTANLQTPLTWYLQLVATMTSTLGRDARFVVTTDAPAADLAPLLHQSHVHLYRGVNALQDLLALTGSSCLITSASTFSQWASFLGQVPTVWFPGQLRTPLVSSTSPSHPQELEWDFGNPIPSSFLEPIRRNLRYSPPRFFWET